MLIMALVAGALFAGLVTPANADQIEVRCSTEIETSIPPFNLIYGEITGIAYYIPVANAPGLRAWSRFRYKVDGINIGTKNNVNIRLVEGGVQKLEIKSPDDRRRGVWYEVRPNSPVFTLVGGPEGPHDHRTDDVVSFEGIYDNSRRRDPRCTAYSPRL